MLTPGRYVGAAAEDEDEELFDVKMKRLVTKLEEEFTQSHQLETSILQNLKRFGFG